MTDTTAEELPQPTPYEGSHRRDLSLEDEPNESDPAETNAPEGNYEGPKEASFGSEKQDHDWKKRHDDLKRYYDHGLNAWREEKEALTAELSSAQAAELPKTEEELEKFKSEYPDVYQIMETVAAKKATSQVKDLEGRVDSLKQKEQQLDFQTAEQKLTLKHSDWPELKTNEGFHSWLSEQPVAVSDGILNNATDPDWAGRVVDLYKADKGLTKKRRDTKKAASEGVNVKNKTSAPQDEDKPIFSARAIAKMSGSEFEKYEKQIDAAQRDGRISE